MALVLADRVRETTTTTGTGTITLAGAVSGFRAFSTIGNANTTYYTIVGQGTTEWEVGLGTYTLTGTTLSRDTVLASSNAGSKVVFSAGTKDVFCDYPASKAIYDDASGNAVGAVYSVGGTGTVAGISLSGTVTTSGNLSLGGTFALPTGQVTTRMIYDSFTATASQTTFTTSTTYTSGKIDVYANGVRMINGSDVTVTSGTSVVFATGLAVGTLVSLVYPT